MYKDKAASLRLTPATLLAGVGFSPVPHQRVSCFLEMPCCEPKNDLHAFLIFAIDTRQESTLQGSKGLQTGWPEMARFCLLIQIPAPSMRNAAAFS
jgi:hypothetical protein